MRRHFFAAALLAAALALPARASSFATDMSDLWWVPSENGWGVNIIHQDDTLFLTFFVYATNGAPTWYVASSVTYQSAGAAGVVYAGALYQTVGPWFGGYFDPGAVGIAPVGNVSVTFDSISTGTLSYSVGNASVVKRIQRQTWRYNDMSGSYVGAVIGTYSGCTFNGYAEETGVFTISQSYDNSGGSTVSVLFALNGGGSCTYSGAYSQSGRMGSIDGTFSCTDGSAGSFHGFEIETTISAVSGRGYLATGGCSWTGRMGGLRRGS